MSVILKRLAWIVLIFSSVCVQAGEVFDRIQKDQLLKVCVWPFRQGLMLRDFRTQSLSGVDYELSQELAKSLKVQAVYVDSSYASMAQDLEQQRCDIAMFGLTIRPVPAGWPIAYSEPYLFSSVFAVTMKGNHSVANWQDVDQPGIIIGVLNAPIAESWVRQHFKHATTVLVGSPNSREKDLQAGRIDVFLIDQIFGRRVIDVYDWVSVLPPIGSDPRLPLGFTVKSNDPQWLDWVNRFIDTVRKDGRLAASAKRYGLTSMLEE